jgi:hypothetical protein
MRDNRKLTNKTVLQKKNSWDFFAHAFHKKKQKRIIVKKS